MDKAKKAAAKPRPTAAPVTGTLMQLDPTVILPCRDNVRFGLKKYRIDSMADDIIENGVLNPIHVHILAEDDEERANGFEYEVEKGSYRLAAVTKLNTESKAGMTIPALVVSTDSGIARLRQQLSENNERENLSPMDEAVAIQKLLNAGMPKPEIRKIFARPTGKKGIALQAASNSFINMRVSFLEFPKNIQAMIHDGRLPVKSAYILTTKDKDKWPAIVEQAEKERGKDIDAEEKQEKDFLEHERKSAEAIQKAEDIKKKLDEATITTTSSEAALNAAIELHNTAVKAAADAYALQSTSKGDAKKTAKEAFTKAEADRKSAEAAMTAAEKVHAANVKALEKAQGTSKAAEDIAAERTKKLAAKKAELETAAAAKAGKAGKTPAASKPLSPAQINKASAAVGADDKPVKLTAAQMRDGIKSIILLSAGNSPKTVAIGEALQDFFDGGPRGVKTDGLLHAAIQKIVGEYKGK